MMTSSLADNRTPTSVEGQPTSASEEKVVISDSLMICEDGGYTFPSDNELKPPSCNSTEVLTEEEEEADYIIDSDAEPEPPAPPPPLVDESSSPRLVPPSPDQVRRYKLLVRSGSSRSDLNRDEGRPEDFHGSTKKTARRSLTKKGVPMDRNETDARPSSWIGSGSSRRKSYTIKTNNDREDNDEPRLATPKSAKPKLKYLMDPSFSAAEEVGGRRAVLKKENGAYHQISKSSPRLRVPDSSDPMVQKYKAMIQSKASASRDIYGRSQNSSDGSNQDWLHVSANSIKTTKRVSNPNSLRPKWGAPDPEDETQTRPSGWLGSPKQTRRSYVIKGEKRSASLASSPVLSSPKAVIAQSAPNTAPVDRRKVSASSLSLGDGSNVEAEGMLSPPKPPPLTSSPVSDRRTVLKNQNGAYHQISKSSARLSVPDSSDPMVQKYKAMIQSKASSSRDIYGRSQNSSGGSNQDWLHVSANSIKTTKRVSNPNSLRPKWGAPDSEDETQARPSGWLGSPKQTRRSYVIKGEKRSG